MFHFIKNEKKNSNKLFLSNYDVKKFVMAVVSLTIKKSKKNFCFSFFYIELSIFFYLCKNIALFAC